VTAGGRVNSLAMMLLHWAQVPAALARHVAAGWIARIPEKRAAAIAREYDAGRGLDSLTGLALLDSCAQFLPLPPLCLLEDDPGARPRWNCGPEFSISHAAGFAACAVAAPGVLVGADLEPADAVSPESLRLVCSTSELARIGPGRRGATTHWTCKEAVLKATGSGIDAARDVEIGGSVAHHAGRRFHLHQLSLNPNLVLTIASTAPDPEVRVLRVMASMLFDLPGVEDRRSGT